METITNHAPANGALVTKGPGLVTPVKVVFIIIRALNFFIEVACTFPVEGLF